MASVTTTKCQCCELLADGAYIAIWMHSSMTASGTGRVRSRRLRTLRVVERYSGPNKSDSFETGNQVK